jgi:hypothetical protein
MGNAFKKKSITARYQWLTPIILATLEASIRRIKVQMHPGQIVLDPFSKILNTKQNWWSGSSGRMPA